MRTCTNCGQENPAEARFCLACGHALAEPARAGEERRVVSVLFVDLVGFTSRAEKLDPEDVRDILTPYYERVRTEIQRFGGTVEKFVGDAVMGVFGAPVAYGDDPERAVRAAFAVRDALAELNAANPDLDLQTRAAVNTGEAIVTLAARPSHGEAMVAGDVVNTAARLQAGAPVGTIIAGEETHAATRSAIEYDAPITIEAKGKATPLRAWPALHPKASVVTHDALPMVGRAQELRTLTEIWERVAGQRRPQLATIFGPAGIGKSRLTREFVRYVESRDGRALRGRSFGYGESGPYGAFAQIVKQIAGIFDNDELSVARDKLYATVARLAGAETADETTAHLAMLIGLGKEGSVSDRETLFFAARLLLEGVAGERPTMLVFDDIHYADASLLDLIEELAARTRDAPLLLLTLARPDLLESRPSWGGGLPAYAALPLEPLDADEADELAARLLGQYGLDEPERAETVAANGEGNPLFIEELSATMAEQGTADADALPTSIRGIVAARLDVLPAEERGVLLDAAVVGKVFWRGALACLDRSRNGLGEVLGSLERRDLIRREAVSRIRGEQQFVFKHGLIRDVAYQTLPRAARRDRHALVAHFLDEVTSETAAAPEVLAHHWREAGETERAVSCVIAAAEQAGRGWAKQRAFALYGEALELIPEDDAEQRKAIRMRQAVLAQAIYHTPEVERMRRRPR